VEESSEDLVIIPAVYGEDNTVTRALRTFKKKTGIKKNFCVTVSKKIPISAGLGGGSSDAACILKILNSMSEKKLNDKELMDLSAEIGSDVPLFIVEGPCIISGRGERVFPVKMEFKRWYIILKPPFGLSSKDVYEEFDRSPETGYLNDLEKPAMKLKPELENLKKILYQEGNPIICSVSGSGSCIFSMFLDRDKAVSSVEALRKNRELKGCEIYLVEGIG
jgi:4-diphosphocytidyl-2-C-methyl-D-erythritol kinase